MPPLPHCLLTLPAKFPLFHKLSYPKRSEHLSTLHSRHVSTGKQAFLIFLIQIAGIGLLGGIFGSSLGLLLQQIFPRLVQDFLPVELEWATHWAPVLLGISLGLLMAGLFGLLRTIDDRGLIRAVATSNNATCARAALDAIGLHDGFAAVMTGDAVEYGKPAPDIYLAAAEQLGVPPASCLALEDSPYGVQAAKGAGMACIAVPNEMTAELDLSAADWRLPSLTVVAEWLEKLMPV